jgi:hypothetical protein
VSEGSAGTSQSRPRFSKAPLLAALAMIAAGCSLNSVSLSTERKQYRAGQTVGLRLHNGSVQKLGYSLCYTALERGTPDGWQAVKDQGVLNPVCLDLLEVLAPLRSANDTASLQPSLPPGRYRFSTRVEFPLGGARQPVSSEEFTVEEPGAVAVPASSAALPTRSPALRAFLDAQGGHLAENMNNRFHFVMLAQSDVRVSQGVGCVTQPTFLVVGGIPIRDAVAISRREREFSKCFTTVRSLREGEGFVVEADLCDGSWVSTVPLPPHQPLEVMGVWNAGPVTSPPPKEGVYQGVVNTAPVEVTLDPFCAARLAPEQPERGAR